MKRDLKYNLKLNRIKTHCNICENDFEPHQLEQHRINPGQEYTDENVIIVCDRCHKIVHKLMRMNKRNSSFAAGWTNQMFIDGARQVIKEGIKI